MRLLNRRSTIAPTAFAEHEDYMIKGDKFEKVLTFWEYPTEFIEGYLAPFLLNSNYTMDMRTEQIDLDYASLLKGERNDLQEKLNRSTDPSEQTKLSERIRALDTHIRESIRTSSRTMNVIINLYVRGDTLEECSERARDIKACYGGQEYQVKLRGIKFLQQGLYKLNSPLFIDDGLRKEPKYLQGQPMTTASVAGLWPWIFDTLEDPEGTLIGRELTSGGKIIFDQFYYMHDVLQAPLDGRVNGNMIIVGTTGSGKSTLMGLIIKNHIMNGRKIVWIDPENRNERLTRRVGGDFISLGRNGHLINIFDLKPCSSDGDSWTKREMYDTRQAVANVVEEIKITFKMLFADITQNELAMLPSLVSKTYEYVGIDPTDGTFEKLTVNAFPTFQTFATVVKQEIKKYTKEDSIANALEISALRALNMKMRHLTCYDGVDGEYAKYFNGTTTISSALMKDSTVLSFGTKDLFQVDDSLKNALLRMIFQYAWSLCLGNEDQECVFAVDEEHMFIQEPKLAEILAVFQRRSRKYHTVTLSSTQEVVEYTNPAILTHGKAIFNNSAYQVYMTLKKNSVSELSKLTSLYDYEMMQIERQPAHQAIMVVGNRHIPIEVLATRRDLQLLE
ncbi:MAG: VirB4 family type IV secretion system protein [Catenibacterium sp.]|uniref:VirB4 family type IV secretion system protein n=1 Tax=Catenibacterium sp. TaxID=2049022 RepID=UPI003993ABF5